MPDPCRPILIHNIAFDELVEIPELYYIRGEVPMLKTRQELIFYGSAILEANQDDEDGVPPVEDPKWLSVDEAVALITWFGEEVFRVSLE